MLVSPRQKAEEASADLPALKAAAEKAVTSMLQGEHAQRKSGSGEKFWQFRAYQPGDRPQDIDWRQSAKTDRVYIRQKEWQTTQTSVFWCNQGTSMDFKSDESVQTKADTAKILTLALGILMTRAGEHINLLGTKRKGRSSAILEHIGHRLCDFERLHQDLPDFSTHKIPRHCSLIQVGDFLSPLGEIEKTFKKLATQTDNGLVVQILDPAEIDLPYDGRIIFEDPAHQTSETVNHVASIREDYSQRIKEHIAHIETLCKHSHWHYIFHRTDTDIKDTLALIWAEMGHKL